jgi:cytoskeleton protein RodZ
MKGFSLDDLSRDTRISPRLLLALEEDRFKDLPAPIFVRGFIRAYCVAVGEPPERALTLYDTASGATRGPSAVPRTAAVVQAPARRSRLGLRRLAPKLGVAGALVAVGGAAYLFATAAASWPSAAPRPRGEVPAAVQPAPVQPATRPVEPRAHVLVARAHESTWVLVRSGDEAPSQEVLEPGSVREWQSAGRFTVTVGNAGGLTLELDGVALPPLGGHGQVVRDVRLPREPAP